MKAATCSKCQRPHSGLCGIPPGVTLGFGAKIGGVSRNSNDPKVKPISKVKPRNKTSVLDRLLIRTKEQHANIQEMLRVAPDTLPNFDWLLQKETDLARLILQLQGQILVRKQKGL